MPCAAARRSGAKLIFFLKPGPLWLPDATFRVKIGGLEAAERELGRIRYFGSRLRLAAHDGQTGTDFYHGSLMPLRGNLSEAFPSEGPLGRQHARTCRRVRSRRRSPSPASRDLRVSTRCRDAKYKLSSSSLAQRATWRPFRRSSSFGVFGPEPIRGRMTTKLRMLRRFFEGGTEERFLSLSGSKESKLGALWGIAGHKSFFGATSAEIAPNRIIFLLASSVGSVCVIFPSEP